MTTEKKQGPVQILAPENTQQATIEVNAEVWKISSVEIIEVLSKDPENKKSLCVDLYRAYLSEKNVLDKEEYKKWLCILLGVDAWKWDWEKLVIDIIGSVSENNSTNDSVEHRKDIQQKADNFFWEVFEITEKNMGNPMLREGIRILLQKLENEWNFYLVSKMQAELMSIKSKMNEVKKAAEAVNMPYNDNLLQWCFQVFFSMVQKSSVHTTEVDVLKKQLGDALVNIRVRNYRNINTLGSEWMKRNPESAKSAGLNQKILKESRLALQDTLRNKWLTEAKGVSWVIKDAYLMRIIVNGGQLPNDMLVSPQLQKLNNKYNILQQSIAKRGTVQERMDEIFRWVDRSVQGITSIVPFRNNIYERTCFGWLYRLAGSDAIVDDADQIDINAKEMKQGYVALELLRQELDSAYSEERKAIQEMIHIQYDIITAALKSSPNDIGLKAEKQQLLQYAYNVLPNLNDQMKHDLGIIQKLAKVGSFDAAYYSGNITEALWIAQKEQSSLDPETTDVVQLAGLLQSKRLVVFPRDMEIWNLSPDEQKRYTKPIQAYQEYYDKWFRIQNIRDMYLDWTSRGEDFGDNKSHYLVRTLPDGSIQYRVCSLVSRITNPQIDESIPRDQQPANGVFIGAIQEFKDYEIKTIPANKVNEIQLKSDVAGRHMSQILSKHPGYQSAMKDGVEFARLLSPLQALFSGIENAPKTPELTKNMRDIGGKLQVAYKQLQWHSQDIKAVRDMIHSALQRESKFTDAQERQLASLVHMFDQTSAILQDPKMEQFFSILQDPTAFKESSWSQLWKDHWVSLIILAVVAAAAHIMTRGISTVLIQEGLVASSGLWFWSGAVLMSVNFTIANATIWSAGHALSDNYFYGKNFGEGFNNGLIEGFRPTTFLKDFAMFAVTGGAVKWVDAFFAARYANMTLTEVRSIASELWSTAVKLWSPEANKVLSILSQIWTDTTQKDAIKILSEALQAARATPSFSFLSQEVLSKGVIDYTAEIAAFTALTVAEDKIFLSPEQQRNWIEILEENVVMITALKAGNSLGRRVVGALKNRKVDPNVKEAYAQYTKDFTAWVEAARMKAPAEELLRLERIVEERYLRVEQIHSTSIGIVEKTNDTNFTYDEKQEINIRQYYESKQWGEFTFMKESNGSLYWVNSSGVVLRAKPVKIISGKLPEGALIQKIEWTEIPELEWVSAESMSALREIESILRQHQISLLELSSGGFDWIKKIPDRMQNQVANTLRYAIPALFVLFASPAFGKDYSYEKHPSGELKAIVMTLETASKWIPSKAQIEVDRFQTELKKMNYIVDSAIPAEQRSATLKQFDASTRRVIEAVRSYSISLMNLQMAQAVPNNASSIENMMAPEPSVVREADDSTLIQGLKGIVDSEITKLKLHDSKTVSKNSSNLSNEAQHRWEKINSGELNLGEIDISPLVSDIKSDIGRAESVLTEKLNGNKPWKPKDFDSIKNLEDTMEDDFGLREGKEYLKIFKEAASDARSPYIPLPDGSFMEVQWSNPEEVYKMKLAIMKVMSLEIAKIAEPGFINKFFKTGFLGVLVGLGAMFAFSGWRKLLKWITLSIVKWTLGFVLPNSLLDRIFGDKEVKDKRNTVIEATKQLVENEIINWTIQPGAKEKIFGSLDRLKENEHLSDKLFEQRLTLIFQNVGWWRFFAHKLVPFVRAWSWAGIAPRTTDRADLMNRLNVFDPTTIPDCQTKLDQIVGYIGSQIGVGSPEHLEAQWLRRLILSKQFNGDWNRARASMARIVGYTNPTSQNNFLVAAEWFRVAGNLDISTVPTGLDAMSRLVKYLQISGVTNTNIAGVEAIKSRVESGGFRGTWDDVKTQMHAASGSTVASADTLFALAQQPRSLSVTHIGSINTAVWTYCQRSQDISYWNSEISRIRADTTLTPADKNVQIQTCNGHIQQCQVDMMTSSWGLDTSVPLHNSSWGAILWGININNPMQSAGQIIEQMRRLEIY